jgi:autotransporter-associated beta strand protein
VTNNNLVLFRFAQKITALLAGMAFVICRPLLAQTNGSSNTFSAIVSFASTNSGTFLNPAFCGLSYEKSQLIGSLLVSNDTSLIGMFSQITPAVLRIGGNSVDTTCWGGLSNLTAITPAQVDAFAGFVKALPSNWRVIYGINFSVNNPTNCAAEAAYAANALGSRLLGFEIGNEPDDYAGNGIRPADYSYSQFLPQWQALAGAITNAVPGWAITNGGNGWVLTGPANSWDTADYTVPFASNEAGVISMLTQHFYLGNPTNASWPLFLQQPISLLLSRVTNSVPAATAANLSLGYRVDECGSFYNGGAPGYSDAYGSALWTLDFMFAVALNGAQGVNLQSGGQNQGYTPIADNGSAVVQARPEFYGLKMFSLMSQGNVVPAVLTLTSNINFNAYGVRQTNGLISVLLNNKETNDYVQVAVNLGTNVPAAQLTWLTGPDLGSTNGYTLGGAAINADGSWAGGVQSVISATNGQVNLLVPPVSAVLVHSFVPPSSNAFLTSIALRPGELSPAFTTNGFTYWATNGYAQTPSVTISNADPTATSTLSLNGKSPVLLFSGVASLSLPLSVGTNSVQVLVTAQDGATTNLYTVNVIVLPPAGHNLIWTTASNNITDGAGIWYQTSNSVTSGNGAWFDGVSYYSAMQSGDNVTFGGGAAGAVATVTNGPNLTPGSITFTNAYGGGGYTIGTATTTNSISMSGGLIANSGTGASVTINSALNGSFTFGGNSSLVLGGNGNQTILNTVTVLAGSTLQVGNNGASGGLGAAMITNNGIINWKRNGQNNPVNISNVVYGTGSVKFWGNGATFVVLSNLFYTGTTTLQPSASTSTNCLVQLGGNNVLPTNTALNIAQNSATPSGAETLNLNGFNQTVGSLAGDQYATATSEIITNSSATPATLTLGGTSKTTGYGGMIAGNLSLTINGTGSTLILSNAASTYTGPTTVSAGALKLTGSAAIASPTINLSASTATFDISTVTGGYTLGTGQTLSGIGVVTGAVTTASGSTVAPGNAGGVGTLSFSNSLVLNGNLVFKINKSLAQSNDLISVLGKITNNGMGTLMVNNLGPVPVAGDKFKLFNSAVVNGGSLTIVSTLGTNFVNYLAVDGSISLPSPRNLEWTSVSGSLTEGGGTWNQGSMSLTSGNGAWYDGTNYGVIMQSGDNVTFGGGTAGSAGTITNGTALIPGNITFAYPYGGGYTIGASTADPAITMNGGLITNSIGSPLMNCPLNGSFTLYNSGGTFTLAANGNQTSANTVTLASGTLQIGNNGNSGALGAAVITNNGALQWKRNNQNTVTISNVIYGTGSVKFWGNGATFVVLSNLLYAGTTLLQPTAATAPNNFLQLGGNNVLPTNTALTISQTGPNPTNAEVLDLNGFNQTVGSLAGDQYATATSEIITNSSATPATLTLGGTSKTTGYGGMIAGNLSLTINGTGSTLILSNANTYTGPTTVNAGKLALKGGGSVSNSSGITVAGGATLDVSGLFASFNLGGGQTLSNSTGGAVINGTNNTGPGVIFFTYDGVNPSFIITNGGMNLSSSTVFNVNNTGSALGVGRYTIIARSATGNAGLVAGAVPASVNVVGHGTAGPASLQITNGQLNLVVSPGLPATGTNLLFNVAGNQVTLSWPTNYVGWLLQSNSVNLAFTNYWYTVPGSATTNRVPISIVPGNANVFYRMLHP